jgi:predicted ribosome quality control (RQC) complex YloA/Tae2 family protein
VHNNFYFLRQLSKALENRLMSTVISECFSQHKDELMIRFETTGKSFYIKANLTAAFSCLSFPGDFQRARKNSVDLFQPLIGQRVKGIRQYDHERSFSLLLSNDYSLLFKMHGNRSNLILFEKNVVQDLFKKNIPADEGIQPDHLDRTIDWTFGKFLESKANLAAQYFTFGKPVWKYLEQKGFDALNDQQQFDMILDTKELLEAPEQFSIAEDHRALFLTLLPADKVVASFRDPMEAINDFYHRFVQQHVFSQERSATLSSLLSKLESSQSFLDKNRKKLEEIEHDTRYKVWADLIMANLHNLKSGQEKATVENFYHDNHPIDIKLKKDLTPQRNAEVYYRKAKNQHIEINRLRQILESKASEVENLKAQITALEEATDLKAVRKLTQHVKDAHPEKKDTAVLPYHEFEFKGYKIWVGKNAQRNDELTQKFSYKDDLWLHAKDVAGSHVLIKHQAGKNFPKDVIERAAQLAAYHSKRKTDSLCPVIVTPKKFVRKRKGDPPGMVVVEREDIVMVEPLK